VDFLISFIGSLLAALLYDAIPALAMRVIKLAAKVAPRDQRARSEEEWLAHLHQCDSNFAKIWHALGCLKVGLFRSMIERAGILALRTIVLYARYSFGSHLKRTNPLCKSGEMHPQAAIMNAVAFVVVVNRLKSNKDLALTEQEKELVRILGVKDFEPAYLQWAATLEQVRHLLPVPK
jgi:hypothetical protein